MVEYLDTDPEVKGSTPAFIQNGRENIHCLTFFENVHVSMRDAWKHEAYNWGVQKLMEENLKVVWPEFSILS